MGIVEFDGLLEGHESPGIRFLYRLLLGCIVLLSLFCAFGNVGLVKHSGARASSIVNALVILGLTALLLKYVTWYKRDGMDPKFKKSLIVYVILLLLLDVGSLIDFHDTLTYKEKKQTVLVSSPHPKTTNKPNPFSPAPSVKPNLTHVRASRHRWGH